MNGAILLTVYNLPEEVLLSDADDRVVDRVIVGVMMFLAPLLATAPLVEWWYDRLGRMMNITVVTYRGYHEYEDQL